MRGSSRSMRSRQPSSRSIGEMRPRRRAAEAGCKVEIVTMIRGPVSIVSGLSSVYSGESLTVRDHGLRNTGMIKVAILGGSGYTAAELIKILLRHPQMNLTAVTTRQISERIGEDPTGLGETSKEAPLLSELHPSLTGRINLRCESFDPDRLLARGVQCIFGCLPHGVSRTALPALLNRGVRVIDLSADYRLRDANVYAQWYGESHGDLAHLAQAVYGLPEIYGEEIATAQLVANPGCYPQTAILGF